MHARHAGQLQTGGCGDAATTCWTGGAGSAKVSAGIVELFDTGEATAGRTRNKAFGPHAVHSGNSIINANTATQAE
jgi:hypothetical protein